MEASINILAPYYATLEAGPRRDNIAARLDFCKRSAIFVQGQLTKLVAAGGVVPRARGRGLRPAARFMTLPLSK